MANEPLQIKVNDSELRGTYSNVMQVVHTKDEFVLNFFTVLPPVGGIMSARVIMSPGHLKRMVAALQENIKRYEQQYGSLIAASEPDGQIGFRAS